MHALMIKVFIKSSDAVTRPCRYHTREIDVKPYKRKLRVHGLIIAYLSGQFLSPTSFQIVTAYGDLNFPDVKSFVSRLAFDNVWLRAPLSHRSQWVYHVPRSVCTCVHRFAKDALWRKTKSSITVSHVKNCLPSLHPLHTVLRLLVYESRGLSNIGEHSGCVHERSDGGFGLSL